MKKLRLNATLLLCAAILAACSGGSTEYVDYAPVDNTPKLDMKAAIYQGILPSGYKLTLTVDQIGTDGVSGAYTIKDGATIISRGIVSNLTTDLALLADKSPCVAEGLTAKTSNVTATSADLTISGFGCTGGTTGQAVTTTTSISKVAPLPAQHLKSQGTTGTGDLISIDLISADDVNFVGSLKLSNQAQQTSAAGTIVAKARNFTDDSAVVNINTLNGINPANGLLFDRATNFSGNFFTANVTKITGQLNTFSNTSSGPFSITGMTVTPVEINTPLTALTVDPVSILTIQGYTPLFP